MVCLSLVYNINYCPFTITTPFWFMVVFPCRHGNLRVPKPTNIGKFPRIHLSMWWLCKNGDIPNGKMIIKHWIFGGDYEKQTPGVFPGVGRFFQRKNPAVSRKTLVDIGWWVVHRGYTMLYSLIYSGILIHKGFILTLSSSNFQGFRSRLRLLGNGLSQKPPGCQEKRVDGAMASGNPETVVLHKEPGHL